MIKIKKLTENAKIPQKAHDSDAGYDLFSVEEKIIPAHSREAIHTGISIELPNLNEENREIYVRIAPRSGLSVKSGIDVFAGVVDRGYTGELIICLYNSSKEDFKINIGDKIAQMIPTIIYNSKLEEVTDINESTRGDKGFGSSGK
jgi:dUTP pyrophosphatase